MKTKKLVSLVLVLLIGLLLAACGGDDSEAEPAAGNAISEGIAALSSAAATAGIAPTPEAKGGSDAGGAADTAGDSTTAGTSGGTAPVDIPLATLPRTFSYAGVEFTVTSGLITNRSLLDPNSAGEQFRAELSVEGTNESGFKALISNGALRLNFADASVVEQVLIDAIEVNATRTFMLTGPVLPGTQWEGATLTLSEPDREPLTIALSGDQTVTGVPIPLSTGGEATGLNQYDESIHFQVLDASLRLDGPQSGGYYVHVPIGMQFLMVTVNATNTGGQNGVSVYAEQFQVVADGVTYVFYYDVNGAQSVALNGSTDVGYTFLIPANAASIQLIVAADGKQPQPIPLK